MDRKENTRFYTYYNANPKNRITGDCVVRSISVFLKKDYYEVYKELYDVSIGTGYMLNDKKNYEKYLKGLGIERQKQPRKADNTKYTGKEFITDIADPGKRYLAKIGGHHITAIVDGKILDIWNCSEKSIGNYWVLED